ncbi:MAG: glycosyltransferase family 2 protein [Thermoplasmata archaeon]
MKEILVPRVMVAIPAYNEETAIGSVVLKALKHADEVVVVDDGSSDRTAEIARLAGAHVIRHARNVGKGMAIRSAFLHARDRMPDVLVLLDGDNQHDPDEIPTLVKPVLDSDCDVSLGVRWGKTAGMPLYRRAGKRTLDYATSVCVKNGMVTDSQCGFRAFSRKAYAELEPEVPGIGTESQMLAEAQQNGLVISETNVNCRYDVDGSTLKPGRHGMSVLGTIVSLVSERRPLFFFGVPGIILIIAGSLLGVWTLNIFYSTGELAIGYSLLVVLLLIVGILAIFIGVTLNVIRSLFKQAAG